MSKFIHDFIHTLTIREKAYFKRYAKTYSDKSEKNYLRLYNTIEKMPVFDAHQLKNKFADEPLGKYLSSELNYLFEQLLRSLTNFHFDSSPQRKLQKSILYIDILIEKGYRKRGIKILTQAKKLAYRYEDFTTILKLIQLEEEILFTEGILGFTEKLADLQLERQKINDRINTINKLRLMREQIRELQYTDMNLTDMTKYPEFQTNPLIDSDDTELSIRGQDHLFYIQALRFCMVRDYKKAQAIFKKLYHFLEEHEYFFKKAKFLSTLSNFLYTSALVKDEKSYFEMLPFLEKLEKDPKMNKVYISFIKYARTLELYYQTKNIKATEKMVKNAGEYTSKHLAQMGTTQSNYIFFLLTRGNIFIGDYNTAIDWLNQWHRNGILEYTVVFARLFPLILHLELEWEDLLANEVEAAYKALKRHKKYDHLAKAFLTFFRSYLRSPKQLKPLLEKLEKKLTIINNDPNKNGDFEYFDFLDWCQEKILRTPDVV